MTTQADESYIPEWTFGDRLRKVRRGTHMTQAAFARALDVGEKAYMQWEADNNRPSDIVDIAQRVERITGVPATWMLGLGSPAPTTGPGLRLLPQVDSNHQHFDYQFGSGAVEGSSFTLAA
jgi:transcriptional regulator with XRE-family HTH domain